MYYKLKQISIEQISSISQENIDYGKYLNSSTLVPDYIKKLSKEYIIQLIKDSPISIIEKSNNHYELISGLNTYLKLKYWNNNNKNRAIEQIIVHIQSNLKSSDKKSIIAYQIVSTFYNSKGKTSFLEQLYNTYIDATFAFDFSFSKLNENELFKTIGSSPTQIPYYKRKKEEKEEKEEKEIKNPVTEERGEYKHRE